MSVQREQQNLISASSSCTETYITSICIRTTSIFATSKPAYVRKIIATAPAEGGGQRGGLWSDADCVVVTVEIRAFYKANLWNGGGQEPLPGRTLRSQLPARDGNSSPCCSPTRAAALALGFRGFGWFGFGVWSLVGLGFFSSVDN